MRLIAIDFIHVATFAMLGCWLRMLLSHFTGHWSGVPFRDFWANVVGCAVMGALATRRALIVDQLKRINLQTSLLTAGLMSGFCGSLTSFSGWSQSATEAILNADVSLWVFIWLAGTATSMFAFSLLSRPNAPEDKPSTIDNSAHDSAHRPSSTWMLLMFLVALCVFMTVFKPSSANWMLPPLFAIIGAALRFVLQEVLNKRFSWFPSFGTFVCNLIGAVLLGVLRRFGAAEPTIGDEWQTGAISLLPIVGIGFCGALSTVSSMANEMMLVLDRRPAIIYAIATCLFAHGIGTLVQLKIVN